MLDLEDQSSLVDIVNAVVDPKHSSITLLKSSLCVSVIIIAEMICLFLIYDYGFFGIFILTDEENSSPRIGKLRRSMIKENPYIEDSAVQITEQLNSTRKKPLGKVYKAEYNDEIVFYRVVNFSRISPYVTEEINKEIKSYKGLSVSGIVPIIGIIFQISAVGLVYPYFKNGSLFKLLHNSKTI